MRNICAASKKAQEVTLSQVKRQRNITLAKQMWHWKSKGECVFLSRKDQADQILAAQQVLILT